MPERSPFALAELTQRILLADKLRIPRSRCDLVSRADLVDRIDRAADKSLVLVCAPPGYGKTTVLAEWASQSRRRVAWVTLDKGDNDPSRFWAYVLCALYTESDQLADDRSLTLMPPDTSDQETFLAPLLNQLRGVEDEIVLVLDDYHVIETPSIHSAVAFMIEHAPPQMQIVLASRSVPPIPTPRLVARDMLMELGEPDLRFDKDETREFFERSGLSGLSAADISLLQSKTEGWAAGLRLAAISMARVEAPASFAAELRGSHRRISDYLADEVLHNLPPHLREFVLKTSILDRLSAPLCDALLEQEGGYSQPILEELERRNTFIISLDDERTWYRYHRLFTELLRVRLKQTYKGETLAKLYDQASTWSENEGRFADAIEMALEGEDLERAAELIARHRFTFMDLGETRSMLGWLNMLPSDMVRSRPLLSLAKAWALVPSRRLGDSEACVRDAEAGLDAASGVSLDAAEERGLRGEVAAVRAMRARVEYDAERIVAWCRYALELLPPDAPLRDSINLSLGVAHKLNGDFHAARRTLTLVTNPRVRQPRDLLSSLGNYYLACIPLREGRLREAQGILNRALSLVTSSDGVMPIAGMVHVALAGVAYEMNELDESETHLELAFPFIERYWMESAATQAYVTLGRIEWARGNHDDALMHFATIGELLKAYDRNPFHTHISTPMLRRWCELGYVQNAQQIIDAVDDALARDEEMGFELADMTHSAAHLLMVERQFDRALKLLGLALPTFEQLGLNRQVIEVLVLQSVSLAAKGDCPAALPPLSRALTLARLEGFVRTFVDEGPAMLKLLDSAKSGGICVPYVDKLMAVFPESERNLVLKERFLAGPLTARETEILRLTASGMSPAQIAEKLVISTATVREHLKHIYSKLGVHSRLQAVQQAAELSLL